jgi:AraC-like DNA-binding protein
LRALPPPEWPQFETMADELGLSHATLRRRLLEEGQSFQRIKDGLRRDMAIDLLTHSDKPITHIAIALGFAEPSAFHRAFRQWTGARPGEYRQFRTP